jgi:hypothetical protein
MEAQNQYPPMDQRQFQKVVNDLMSSQEDELDQFERESLTERAKLGQAISNLDSQIKNLEIRLDNARSDRMRSEGASDYVLQKVAFHRYKKMCDAGEEIDTSDVDGTEEVEGATETAPKLPIKRRKRNGTARAPA